MLLRPRAPALCLVLCLIAVLPSSADPKSALVLGPEDLRIEQRTDGGYHLFVRARPGIGSILLTESTSDPGSHEGSYAYRALEWNPVNGDEKRLVDGAFLPRTSKMWTLIDSTPEPDPRFGSAFHIFIPWVVAWGYPTTRNGRVFIGDGSFIDIRVFAKPYADYTGPFADNPFMLRVRQRAASQPVVPAPTTQPAAPPPPAQQAPPSASPTAAAAPPTRPAQAAAAAAAPEAAGKGAPASAQPAASTPAQADVAVASPKPAIPAGAPALGRYMRETVDAFYGITAARRGKTLLAGNGRELALALSSLLAPLSGSSVDLVLCVDSTESMQAALDALRAAAPSAFAAFFARSGGRKVGLVLYRDYFEEYLTKRVDFVDNADELLAQLGQVRVAGGRDLPEAVYEGLYAALTEFPWSADKRIVLLVGDAPPHPLPRGAVSGELVTEAAAGEGVEIDAIVLPHPDQDQ